VLKFNNIKWNQQLLLATFMALPFGKQQLYGFIQIVGHTEMEGISEYQCENGNVIFCDALWNEKYLKF
jgi:hypothetical protein